MRSLSAGLKEASAMTASCWNLVPALLLEDEEVPVAWTPRGCLPALHGCHVAWKDSGLDASRPASFGRLARLADCSIHCLLLLHLDPGGLPTCQPLCCLTSEMSSLQQTSGVRTSNGQWQLGSSEVMQ